jgi:hypothetical protein
MNAATRALVLVALAAALAEAAPLGAVHTDLAAEVETRLAALPADGLDRGQVRQRRALTRASEALTHDADSLAGTLKDGLAVVRSLDRDLGDDGTSAPLLDALVADLRTQFETRAGALEDLVAPYADHRGVGARAALGLRAARRALAVSRGANDRADAVRPLAGAARRIERIESAVEANRRPGGWHFTSSGMGLTFQTGPHRWHKYAAQNPYWPWTFAYDPAGAGTMTLTSTALAQPFGEATVTVTWHGSGRGWFEAVSGSMTNLLDKDGPPLLLTSGTVRVTSWHPELGAFAGDLESLRFSDGTTSLGIPWGSFRWLASAP